MNPKERQKPGLPRRRLRRFFSLSSLPPQGAEFLLSQKQTRHLRSALRLGEGDYCLVIDDQGQEAEAQILKFTEQGETLLRLENFPASTGQHFIRKSSLRLRVYVGMPQRGKMDFIIEKAQELDIEAVVPLQTDYSSVKISPEKRVKVLNRWSRIAQEAAKQSGVVSLTKVGPILTFKEAIQDLSVEDSVLIFHPDEGAIDFQGWIMQTRESLKSGGGGGSHLRRWYCFIGPEGGFSPREVGWADSIHAQKIRLGDTILKVDTAFIFIVSVLKVLIHEHSRKG